MLARSLGVAFGRQWFPGRSYMRQPELLQVLAERERAGRGCHDALDLGHEGSQGALSLALGPLDGLARLVRTTLLVVPVHYPGTPNTGSHFFHRARGSYRTAPRRVLDAKAAKRGVIAA